MDTPNFPPQPIQPAAIKQQPPTNKSPLIIIGILIIFFISAISAGYYLGVKQAIKLQGNITSPALIPTIIPTSIPISTLSTEESTQIPENNPAQVSTPAAKPFYSSDLDATFYIPSGWFINVSNRDPSIPESTKTPCSPSNKEFYKDPNQCIDAADTFLIGINTSAKQSQWPNVEMSIVGPTSGLGGACPPEDYNYITQTLTINNKQYFVKFAQDKSSNAYGDCFLFPTIKESGAKSKWSQFNVFFQAKDKATLDEMLNILQTAKFN